MFTIVAKLRVAKLSRVQANCKTNIFYEKYVLDIQKRILQIFDFFCLSQSPLPTNFLSPLSVPPFNLFMAPPHWGDSPPTPPPPPPPPRRYSIWETLQFTN